MREPWLSAMRAQIRLAVQNDDPSGVLAPEANNDLREAVTFFSEHPEDLDVGHAVGWFYWLRYRSLPEEQGRGDLQRAVDALVGCFITGIGSVPSALLPLLAEAAAPWACDLLEKATNSADIELLAEAIRLWRSIIQATPDDNTDRILYVSNLGLAFQRRFELAGAESDLNEAVTLGQESVRITPGDHSRKAEVISNLCVTLGSRFRHAGRLADLDEAIDVLRQALQVTSDGHPGRALCLSNLGSALATRFERTGRQEDLEESVSLLRRVVKSTSTRHPERSIYLSQLASALQSLFNQTGNSSFLNEAIDIGRQVTSIASLGSLENIGLLSNLGMALKSRFEITGLGVDLDEAISIHRRCIEEILAESPSHPVLLNNFGGLLEARFHRTGNMGDLDESVKAFRCAVNESPGGHPDRAGYLCGLSGALQSRFRRTGDRDDVNKAIDYGRHSVSGAPLGHRGLAGYRFNLGLALWSRFENEGGIQDLDEAIEEVQQAVQGTPVDNTASAMRFSALGGILQARFIRTGKTKDLDEAIAFQRRAVQDTSDEHTDRMLFLSNLGGALIVRFEHSGAPEDVNEAIITVREALLCTPADHPDRMLVLTNLSAALQSRFKITGDRRDLDEAITILGEAVHVFPEDRPERTRMLTNLGVALHARFEHAGVPDDREAAMSALAEAWSVRSAAPTLRIQAGRAWAGLMTDIDPARAAGVLQEAVKLLPRVAARQLGRSDQQHALGRFAGLAGQAAAAILAHPGLERHERAMRALSAVETGRGVLLGQALDTRTELTDLRRRSPDLAADYARLRDHLDLPARNALIGLSAPEDTETTSASNTITRSRMGAVFTDRNGLAREFDEVLERIRALEGFETFGSPPSEQELVREAVQGPVVVFTTAPSRCDALLLTTEGIDHLPLPDLTWNTLVEKVDVFQRARAGAVAGPVPEGGEDPQRVLVGVLGWLWDVAAGPVLEALGFGAEPEGDLWPRLWWSPGGLLGLLPLHAAGHHADPPGGRRTVMDRVVSSYTPTVRALRYAREQAVRQQDARGMGGRALIVSMPTTPGLDVWKGLADLPFVVEEVEKVRAQLTDAVVLSGTSPAGETAESAASVAPTKEKVLERLPTTAIAHFACHGYTDPVDPSQSMLVLEDHAENPLNVVELGPLRLERARLAYLSACGTAATTAVELIDEAIHVASAFQLAGFPHVVGTLWEVNDRICATVADLFYTHLQAADGLPEQGGESHNGDGALDPAKALHSAIREVRDGDDLQDVLPGWDRVAAPLLWAPYLHAGA